jgi:hypothetical protein
MKSEERHKLQQNALAVWLEETFNSLKDYQNFILGGVILVVLVIIVGMWWTSESAASATRAWTQFFTALDSGNLGALPKVAEDNPKSKVAVPADLVTADIMLSQGSNLLFENKAAANQALNQALGLYQKVRQQTNVPDLRAQATFGLARTLESAGKLDAAIELYTEVTANWPDTVFARLSSRRYEDLKRISIKDVYDKLAAYDPKPAFTQQPPGAIPDLNKMPEESPIAEPGAIPEQKSEVKKEDNPDNKPDAVKPDENAQKPIGTQQTPAGEKTSAPK